MNQDQMKGDIGRPSNPNRKQRINVTFWPDTLIALDKQVSEKQRSEYIERLVRQDLGLPEMENKKMTGFAAYKRSWNAGFVTEIISVNDSIVVDQIIETYNAASQPEGIPNLVGQSFVSLRGKGFQRITSQRKIDELQERYQFKQLEEAY